MKVILFLLLCVLNNRSSESANFASCSYAKESVDGLGLDSSKIPSSQKNELGLKFCPKGPSCCTPDVELALADESIRKFEHSLMHHTQKMTNPLKTQVHKLNSFIEALLKDSQEKFDYMFTRTYGLLYKRNKNIFDSYFTELRSYYSRGRSNLIDSTSAFFTNLFQKLFQTINAQYSFDDEYLSCLAENMNWIQPFGSLPKKIATSVKRSLVAARALSKSLEDGVDIAKELSKTPKTDKCTLGIATMNTCSICSGIPDARPCQDTCWKVTSECLIHHGALMQELWDKYVVSSLQLVERLSGPFNTENVINPLGIRVSEAIMSFQESGYSITQKVMEKCGKPVLVKRSVSDTISSDAVFAFDAPEEKKLFIDKSSDTTEFVKILKEVQSVINKTEGFWYNLPRKLCENGSKSDNSAKCSSSHEESSINERYSNPAPTIFHEQKFRLQSVYNTVRLANNGQDVEWFDQESDLEEDSSSGDFYQGSGEYTWDISGSGAGDISEDDWDDWNPFSTTTTTTEDPSPASTNEIVANSVSVFLISVSLAIF